MYVRYTRLISVYLAKYYGCSLYLLNFRAFFSYVFSVLAIT